MRHRRTIRLSDLPEDMQIVAADLAGEGATDGGRSGPSTADGRYAAMMTFNYPLHWLDLADVGPMPWSWKATEKRRALAMPDVDLLPPVVVAGARLIDGHHRVFAARHQGKKRICMINLNDSGLDFVDEGIGTVIYTKKRRTQNPPLMPADPAWSPDWYIEAEKGSAWYIRIKGAAGNIVGDITLTPSHFVRGAWQVVNILVKHHYEGRGIGQTLYLLAMRLLGKVHPDWENSVSPSAMRTWAAMKRRGLIVGTTYAGFEKAKITDPTRIQLERDMPRADYTAVDDVVQLPGQSKRDSIVFPKGWRGILDQVYTLKDPKSVPLVEITRP